MVDGTVTGFDRAVTGVARAVAEFAEADRAVAQVDREWLGLTRQMGDWFVVDRIINWIGDLGYVGKETWDWVCGCYMGCLD